jgi:hypothetical protein
LKKWELGRSLSTRTCQLTHFRIMTRFIVVEPVVIVVLIIIIITIITTTSILHCL